MPLCGLITACEHEYFPKWAEDDLIELENGGLMAKLAGNVLQHFSKTQKSPGTVFDENRGFCRLNFIRNKDFTPYYLI